MSLIFNIFISAIGIILDLVVFIIPKKDNLWLCGAWFGERYSDNSKYFFEYLIKQKCEKVIWLTKNEKVYEKLKKSNFPVIKFNTLKSFYYALRAKNIVLSVSYADVDIFTILFSRKSRIIQLWHGTPLKKLTVKRSKNVEIIRGILIKLMGRECDYVISSSSAVSEVLNDYFHILRNKFLVCGYPRNDALFKNCLNVSYIEDIKKRIIVDKIVFYLPTFREYKFNDPTFEILSSFGFNKERIDEFLEKNNTILLIKLHYRDQERLKADNRVFGKRIFFINDSDIDGDIYPLLSITDILITDYSSVYFDFLVLNRPIIFLSPDIEDYVTKDRGFYFDYQNITPGPKVTNWDSVLLEVENELKNSKRFEENRKQVNGIINEHKTEGSSKRVFENLKIINDI